MYFYFSIECSEAQQSSRGWELVHPVGLQAEHVRPVRLPEVVDHQPPRAARNLHCMSAGLRDLRSCLDHGGVLHMDPVHGLVLALVVHLRVHRVVGPAGGDEGGDGGRN